MARRERAAAVSARGLHRAVLPLVPGCAETRACEEEGGGRVEECGGGVGRGEEGEDVVTLGIGGGEPSRDAAGQRCRDVSRIYVIRSRTR